MLWCLNSPKNNITQKWHLIWFTYLILKLCCVPGSAFTVVSRTSMNDWMQKTHTEWLIDRNVIQGNVDLVTWSTRVNHVALWMCIMLAVDTHNVINTLLHGIVGDVELWIFPAGEAYLPFWFGWRGWRRCRLLLGLAKRWFQSCPEIRVCQSQIQTSFSNIAPREIERDRRCRKKRDGMEEKIRGKLEKPQKKESKCKSRTTEWLNA